VYSVIAVQSDGFTQGWITFACTVIEFLARLIAVIQARGTLDSEDLYYDVSRMILD
jgi:hypothetical protein